MQSFCQSIRHYNPYIYVICDSMYECKILILSNSGDIIIFVMHNLLLALQIYGLILFQKIL